MNLLYSSLESIYKKDTNYSSYFPLESLHYFLRNFYIDNVKDGNYIIDPLDFSHKYNLSSIKTLDIFLLLADYGVLIKQYHLTCDECGTPTVENNIEDFYECFNCKHLLLNLSIPLNPDMFNNIKYVFEFTDYFLDEIRSDIKNPPPSSSFNPEEEGSQGMPETNLTSVFENTDPSLKGLSLEQEVLNKLRKGILNIS